MCVGGEQGTIAFVDRDLKAVICRPVDRVCCMVGHVLRGGVDIVVGDDGCEVVNVVAIEICSVGVVGNKEVKEARGNN